MPTLLICFHPFSVTTYHHQGRQRSTPLNKSPWLTQTNIDKHPFTPMGKWGLWEKPHKETETGRACTFHTERWGLQQELSCEATGNSANHSTTMPPAYVSVSQIYMNICNLYMITHFSFVLSAAYIVFIVVNRSLHLCEMCVVEIVSVWALH